MPAEIGDIPVTINQPTALDVMTPAMRRMDALLALGADARAAWTYLESATVAVSGQAVYVAVDDDVDQGDWLTVCRLIESAGWGDLGNPANDIGQPAWLTPNAVWVYRLRLSAKGV